MTSNKDLNIPPLFVEFVQNFVQEYLEVLEQKNLGGYRARQTALSISPTRGVANRMKSVLLPSSMTFGGLFNNMAYSAEESSPILYSTESCCICDEEFSSDSDLANHLVTHADEEVFKAGLLELEKKTPTKHPPPHSSTPVISRTVSLKEPLKRTASQRSKSPEVWEIISDDSDDESNKNKKSAKLSNSFRLKREHVRERKKPPASFTREIRCIMHSFGDCKKPLWETVLYVEKILRQQMNLLLTKSSEVCYLRKGECISHEDLLFLLRNNKIKLKRLLRYLNIKDAKEVIKLPSRLTDLVRNPACGKRVKKCMKFLNSIDNLFMYEDILNEEIPDPKLEFRNKRKFDMVFSMSTEEYLEFKDTQQTTFFPKGGAEEFTAWLLEDGITDLTPSSFALEIINFFARETICEIIDLVMILREDKISQTVHIPSAQESIEMKESDSNVEEKCSTNDCKDAITVLEIQEALQRYIKISDKNKFFYNDNLNVLIPDDLLCC